jgi:penicillin-binding protein 1A
MLAFRALRTLFFGIVIGGIAVGACLAAVVPGAEEIATGHKYTVKTVGKLRELSQKSYVYWADGSYMEGGELGLQDRQNITFQELDASEGGRRVIKAVVATEDQTFWTNDGIDLGAVFRAFVSNVTSGEIQQGGSTITQQLVKNRILSPARDVNRKVKEIEDALRLNEKFSKKKILEEYLNTVYFGQNSYGIRSTSYRFFNKPVDQLSIGEAALLAGVIANPEGTNPFRYASRAWKRRADVLQLEVGQGYITQAEADAAKNEPLPTVPPPDELRPRNFLAAEVQDRLLNDPQLGATPKERYDRLLKGGLKIYTTFDRRLQDLAQRATTEALPGSPAGPDWVSSLVAIDPATGAVKAMVGNRDFNESQYNIATHEPGRQPGSTWKIITLGAALQNGYSPNDTVNGSAPCSVPSKFGAAQTTNSEGAGGGGERLWEATSGSVNCAFVRLSTSVGQDKVMQIAHDMGITQQRLFPHLTLSIGDIEATPLEMATVIATIANDGLHHPPYVVQKVVAPNGEVLIDNATRPLPANQALAPDVAECEQIMMRGVITGGTGSGLDVPGHEPFGKTGTTDGQGDAWFVGATSQLATAVWFGNRTTNALAAGFGGAKAGPIWRAFMTDALDGLPGIPLPDRASNAVCNRPGKQINQDGGHGASVGTYVPSTGTPSTPAPTQPPRVVAPITAPTAPPNPTTPTTPPGNGNGPGQGTP